MRKGLSQKKVHLSDSKEKLRNNFAVMSQNSRRSVDAFSNAGLKLRTY